MHLFSLCTLSAFFMATGLAHFAWPAPFLKIMPSWVPWPKAVNLAAGAWECACALALPVPRFHVAAAAGLVALLVAVFPANVRMLTDKEAGFGIEPVWLWARLPLQALLVYWVWTQIAQ